MHSVMLLTSSIQELSRLPFGAHHAIGIADEQRASTAVIRHKTCTIYHHRQCRVMHDAAPIDIYGVDVCNLVCRTVHQQHIFDHTIQCIWYTDNTQPRVDLEECSQNLSPIPRRFRGVNFAVLLTSLTNTGSSVIFVTIRWPGSSNFG